MREGCVPNIGPRQRRLRVIFGALVIAGGGALAVVLLSGEASRWFRLVMLVPGYLAAVSLLQAHGKT